MRHIRTSSNDFSTSFKMSDSTSDVPEKVAILRTADNSTEYQLLLMAVSVDKYRYSGYKFHLSSIA